MSAKKAALADCYATIVETAYALLEARKKMATPPKVNLLIVCIVGNALDTMSFLNLGTVEQGFSAADA